MAGIPPPFSFPPPPSTPPGGPGSGSTSTGTSSSSTSTTTSSSGSTSTGTTSSSSSPTSSSSSSTSSSSSSSSVSSSSSTSTLTSTHPTPTSALTTPPLLPTPTNTGGSTFTSTSTQFISNTLGAAPVQTAVPSKGGSKSFFANKGAVAGVFSVVGLIVLALIIALVTNGLRRRRARKFDRELQEATLEAASAPKPIFLDDDDDLAGGPVGYGGRGGGGYGAGGVGEYSDYGNTGGGGFSDVSSHGTHGQPPLSVSSGHGGHMESYNMRELGPSGGVGPGPGPSPGEIFDPYAIGAAGVGGAAGAAGIGVARARSTKISPEASQPNMGAYGAALQEGAAPYAAFAGPPQYGGYDPYANHGGGNNTQRNADILEAAGMGAHLNGAGVGLNRGPSMGGAYGYQQQQQSSSQEYNSVSSNSSPGNLGRNRSIGGMAGMAPVQEQYDAYGNTLSAQPPQQQPMSATSGNSGATQYFSPVAESYASHYQSQGQGQPPQPTHQKGLSVISGGGTDADGDMDDAYGGFEAAEVNEGNKLPNPFANAASDGGHHGGSRESRYSDDDDEVEEQPRRVLKVANE